MLAHYLSLALRVVGRTKLYAAISVTGLAIGFAAATLIGLYIHDELTYERWIPNNDRIYQVSAGSAGGRASGVAPSDLAVWLKSDYPQFAAVTRLYRDQAFFADEEHQDRKFSEPIVWADASTFDVFRFPVIAGSLDGALERPDSLVITRVIARKYFRDENAAVGKTLLYNGERPMTVTAVIQNMPSNTHLTYIGILAAAHAEFSPLAEQDRTPIVVFGGKTWNSATYVLLRPGEAIAPIRESLATLVDRHAPQVLSGARKASEVWPLVARPIRAIHLSEGVATTPDAEEHSRIYSIGAIGLLIVLVASINFVNLLTALGVRRALEVGVRKALGARRRDLFAQFMSESFLYVGVGAVVGVGLGAAMLRPLNTFLQRTIDFSLLTDWRVVAGVPAFLAVVALLAGLYPAMVLSAFRPATVAKGGRGGRGHSGVRQGLVVLQFAILIALLVATTVTYRQTALGLREGLRQNTDPIVILNTTCSDALKNELRRTPGVLDAQCSMVLPQWGFGMGSVIRRGDREPIATRYLPVDYGFFQMYGYELAAGRYFDSNLGTEQTPADNVWKTPEALVINETAARQFGFTTPQDALGQTLLFSHLFRMPATFTPAHDANVIGVIKDFQIGSVREAVPPAVFYVDPGNFRIMSMKLDGRSTPEAIEAIDRVWRDHGDAGPANKFFFVDSIQNMYLDLRRTSQLFSVFAGIAILIAVLGLIGLAAHAAVSRTKEIGIRKALGGGRGSITRLLLWQFSIPVLLANVIAWPAAYWAMSVWLRGFAKRVDLDWWMFVAAAGATLVVAVAAVLVHTWGMAGTRPVEALRYE